MINWRRDTGLVLISLLVLACSVGPTSGPSTDAVREHADKAFRQLNSQESTESSSPPPTSFDGPSTSASSSPRKIQVPLAEIGSSDGEYIRATGYGDLSKGLYLCQHSADLAARVELSKLVSVRVKETSVDRIRERTGTDAQQDIEVVREGTINEVLHNVRIVSRTTDKEAGTCASTAVIPKRELLPSADRTVTSPQ